MPSSPRLVIDLTPRQEVVMRSLGMILGFAFCALLFTRNMPYSTIRIMAEPLHHRIVEPLGLYHMGWGMFGGTTTQTPIVQIVYTYADGSTKIEQPFPFRSAWIRSPWTEVMEVIAVRDNKNDPQRVYRQNYFAYQCNHRKPQLAKAEVQMAVVYLQDLYANKGQPLTPPVFTTNYTMTCVPAANPS